jgi:hypothetical protein
MSTNDTPATPGEITGAVLFYSKPEPLNIELHGKYGVKRMDKPFSFAANAHLVPLAVTEFSVAAASYPIIFVGDDRQPAAVMGLREGENLYVNEAGDFDFDSYIPAFMRRVPFVFANDPQAQRLILCIDAGSPMVDPEGGDVKLFEDGKATPYTEGVMNFCKEFESERARTTDFVKILTDLDLFEIKKATFTPPPGPDGVQPPTQDIAEYTAISEEKLAKLSDAKLGELVRNGALQQCYVHLTSLVNWDRLIARALRRPPVANDTAGNA